MTAASNVPPWKRDFGLVVVGTFGVATAFFFLMPVMPLLVVGPLGGDEGAVGLAVGTFSITALAARPFAGWLLDRFGRRIWLLGGALLTVPCMASYGLVQTFAALEALRLMHGLAWGLVTVAMATVAADLVPAQHRGTGMGVYGLAMPLAMALGPLLGAWLLAVGSFDLVFQVGSGIAMAAAVGYAFVRMPGVRNPEARLRLRSMFERRVVSLSVAQTLLCAGFGGWLTFIPIIAPELGLDSAGPLFFWYAVGGLTSRVFAGRWYDLRGPGGPTLATTVLLVAGWVGFATCSGPLMAQASAALLGLGFGTAGTVFLSMAIDVVEPERRGAASATFFSAYDAGIGGGAMTFGLLFELPEVHLVFWWAAGLTLAAGALLAAVTLPQYGRDRLGR